jgi:hypothetical protein
VVQRTLTTLALAPDVGEVEVGRVGPFGDEGTGVDAGGGGGLRPPYQRWIVDNQGMAPWSVTLETA